MNMTQWVDVAVATHFWCTATPMQNPWRTFCLVHLHAALYKLCKLTPYASTSLVLPSPTSGANVNAVAILARSRCCAH